MEYSQRLGSKMQQRKWPSTAPGNESKTQEERASGIIKEHYNGLLIKTRLHECTIEKDSDATEGNPVIML
jgi:hypothetical protein